MLEVIACSAADAIAAERGGATRLEVVNHIEHGGLTPALTLVDQVLDAVRVPIRVMLRERDAFAIREPAELDRLCATAEALAARPIDGLVVGYLRDGAVDLDALARITAAAPRLRVTFHRAIEQARDPINAIAGMRRLENIDCVLTSGAAEASVAWSDRIVSLRAAWRAAQPGMTVLVGGGVDEGVITGVCASTPIRAFHLGRAVRDGRAPTGPVLAERVEAMRRRLEEGS